MAIQTSCPHCQESYKLPETQLGKKVRCKGCSEIFVVKGEDEVPMLEEATAEDLRTAVKKTLAAPIVEELPVLDGPRRSVRDERPPPPRRRDDDDDDRRDRDRDRDDPDEEEPQQGGGGGGMLAIIGAVLAILLLLGVGGGLAIYFAMQTPSNQQANINQPGNPNNDGGKINPAVDGGKVPVPNKDRDKDKDKIVQPRDDNDPPKDVAAALEMLKDARIEKKQMAVRFLASAKIEERQREDVEKALEPFQEDGRLGDDVEKALLHWAPGNNVDRLAKQLQSPRRLTARRAMEQLSKIDDDKAAAALTTQLTVLTRDRDAAQYLSKMGKRAEKHVLPFYNHHFSPTRDSARKVLSEIKTSNDDKVKQCLDDLDKTDQKLDEPAMEQARTGRRRSALEALATLKPLETDKDTNNQIAKKLEAIITSKEVFLDGPAFDALEVFATTANIETLLAMTKDVFKRDKATKVLFTFKADEKMLPVLVAWLGEDRNRVEAAKALVGHGEKAEKAILAVQVNIPNADAPTRRAAYEVLGVVGTKDSLKPLGVFLNLETKRKDAVSVQLAKVSIQAITAREKLKDDKKDKDKEKAKDKN